MKDLGTNFGQLEAFIARLRREGIGEATSQALHAIITTKGKELQLELALAMDMEILCTTTYRLEGDGLEILLVHDLLESLRERGRRAEARPGCS